MRKYFILIVVALFSAGFAFSQVSSGKSESKKISFKKPATSTTTTTTGSITQLPDLIITGEKFIDENKNNIINSNEKCSIAFKVQNIGKGTGMDVKVKASLKKGTVSGVTFTELIPLGNINPDDSKDVTIPIQGKLNTEDGLAEFFIEVMESRGFDAYPLEIKIETRRFAEPEIVIADAIFSTEDGGQLKLNYPINLKILLQNIGAGEAKNVKVDFLLPEAFCIFLGEINQFDVGSLPRGESKELDFLFTATRKYTGTSIPVNLKISEYYGRYGFDTTLSVSLASNLIAKNEVVITGLVTTTQDITIASLSSDVDKNIPLTLTSHPYRYALVIGNEDYSKYQRGLNSESNVEFARNDATIFKDYASRVLGVEEKNLYLLTDATAGAIEQKIDLVSKLAARTADSAEIIFYFAGHGLPDEVTKEPYLIPVDVSGTNLSAAIKLADVYKRLSETGANRITFFLDACFSGGGRDAGLFAARAVKVKPKDELVTGNLVVFSASSGEQSSLPYAAKQHGMFTYFLLKKLQESKGNITYGKLADYIKSNVSLESLRVNNKEQDPTVKVSADVQSTWESWTLN